MNGIIKYFVILFLLIFQSCISQEKKETKSNATMKYEVQKTDAEWKNQLGEERFRILRLKGTEFPHTGEYNLYFEKGT